MYFSTSKTSILGATVTIYTISFNKHKGRERQLKTPEEQDKLFTLSMRPPLCSSFPLGNIQMEQIFWPLGSVQEVYLHISYFFSKLLLTSSPIICLLSLPAIQSNHWMMLMKWHSFCTFSMSLSHKSKQSDIIHKILLAMKIYHPLWKLILYWIYYLDMLLCQ